MSLSTASLDAAYRQAERALRKPSSAVWLRSVCVRTSRFDEALNFYVTVLGLTLGSLEVNPMTARPRARLLDAEGHQVFELVDADGEKGRGVHELAFGMPKRTVTLLRSRLDLHDVDYVEAGGSCLLLRDVDGTRLRIESL
ncbi:MAG: VOC family protein [Bacteroidota bacterium]